MYIKLSFCEDCVVVPGCWGGMLLTLNKDKAPEILDKLPSDVEANTQVNIKAIEEEQSPNREEAYIPKTYDYYLDCGHASRQIIENAIKLFIKHKNDKHSIYLVGDNYPEENPMVIRMTKALDKVRNNVPLTFLFATPEDKPFDTEIAELPSPLSSDSEGSDFDYADEFDTKTPDLSSPHHSDSESSHDEYDVDLVNILESENSDSEDDETYKTTHRRAFI